ncbi:MAG: NAD(P)H-dependent oxidoreductase [bacterium]|nr:NAD(P)H-dependent oxidoreductase [bacterium]
MSTISIISSSIRTGRNSPRVALYFKLYLKEYKNIEAEILDLADYDFPLFKERLRFLKELPKGVVELSEKIRASGGIIIVTPEYNGGYPAALKNVIDLFYEEWKRKPISIATVSSGSFGGSQVITSLQFSLWKIGAWTVPAMFPVAEVEKAFDANGVPADKEMTNKRAAKFVEELLWCMAYSGK